MIVRSRQARTAGEARRRLMEISGIDPLIPSAFVASISDPTAFKTAKDIVA
ncbi:transposase [Ahrensia sp. R2A130]|uniref:transposase n=1 Tax=Ahrensia sp. R2A130 TaxID=744979 RepID=UPI0012E9E193